MGMLPNGLWGATMSRAAVEQCYLCHETTSWNDMEGVAWYKHH